MRMVEPHSKHFVCEVCGQSAANPTTMGIESDRDRTSPMQLCREATVGCTDN